MEENRYNVGVSTVTADSLALLDSDKKNSCVECVPNHHQLLELFFHFYVWEQCVPCSSNTEKCINRFWWNSQNSWKTIQKTIDCIISFCFTTWVQDFSPFVLGRVARLYHALPTMLWQILSLSVWILFDSILFHGQSEWWGLNKLHQCAYFSYQLV